MTNEELVDLIQAGDHVQDNMGLLYQQNRRFITGIALPFSSSVELDDLMQEAYFGLEKAVSKYDPTLGYGCAQAYHWGLGHFKNTGTSATEYLALKHIEQEQSRKNSAKEIRGISTFAQVSSARMKKENGTVPIGLKKLQKTIKQAEALLREADALTKRR